MQKNMIFAATAIVVGGLFLLFAQQPIASYLTEGRAWSFGAAFDLLPGRWKIILIGMTPISMIAVAILVKHLEVRRAQSWIGVPGKIVSSKSVQRNVERSLSSSGDQDHEVRNFAEILYSYKVGKTMMQGARLSIASDLGNSSVAEKLARYRTGKEVTVYYNPAQPDQAVIERDMPTGSLRYAGWIVIGLTAVLFAAVFGALVLTEILRHGLPDPRNAPIVVGLSLFAAVLARFAYVLKQRAASVDGWGCTDGKIVGSGTETFLAARAQINSAQSILLRQRVTYAYRVDGVDYQSDRVSLGARTSSSVRALEQSIVKRYPIGATVTVHYDPTNPSEAVIEPRARMLWVVWASAAFLAAAALLVSGVHW